MSFSSVVAADAPAAIGPYSQVIRAGEIVDLAGQLPLDPTTRHFEAGALAQIQRAFHGVTAVAAVSGASLPRGAKIDVAAALSI